MANTLDSLITDRLTVNTAAVLPANTIGGTQINASDPVPATKQQIQINRIASQVHGSDATAERRPVYKARAAGTLVAVNVGNTISATGADTVTVDIKKNGSTFLSGTVSLAAGAPAAFATVPGSPLSSGAYSAGDVIEWQVTPNHSSGTLPQGVFVELVFREANGG